VAFSSILGDIAADLIGGPVKFYHSKINFKLPSGGEEIGWHQDWLRADATPSATVWPRRSLAIAGRREHALQPAVGFPATIGRSA
jgi:hypothetical protein